MIYLAQRIVPILTSYIIFITTNPRYGMDLVTVATRVAWSLIEDVYLPNPDYPLEYQWSIEQQVAQKGYKFESYKVPTEDGYVLTVFRIPGKLKEPMENIKSRKQPVYMQHGMFDDGGTWLFNSKEETLAY